MNSPVYPDSVIINRRKTPVKRQEIEIEKIMFDVENPRISLAKDTFEEEKEKMTQGQIAYALKRNSYYYDLKASIKDNKGALYDIWVQQLPKKNYIVIEGNTRLLIYKQLSGEYPEEKNFKKIKCVVFSADLDDEGKDFIRLTAHLNGTNEWDTYEKAKYLYALHEDHKISLETLSLRTKLNKSSIKQDIDAFKLMSTQFKKKYGNKKDFVHKFTYFVEYLKNKNLKQQMQNLNFTDADFCDWVGIDKFLNVRDVRKLDKIFENSDCRKLFLERNYDIAIEKLSTIEPKYSSTLFDRISMVLIGLRKMSNKEEEEIKSGQNNAKKKLLNELKEEINSILDDE